MKPFFKTLFLSIAYVFIVFNSDAQCDSNSFAPDDQQIVTNGSITSVSRAGNLAYLLGSFTSIGKATGCFIGLDTVTGHPVNQATWPKIAGKVYTAVSDGAGGWIVGGKFSLVGDSARKNLAQINAAGQVTAWNPSPNGTVRGAAVIGTTAFFGGDFGLVGSTTRNRVAASSLASNTLLPWNPNCNNTIYSVVADGTTVWIAGAFTNVGGNIRNHIAALDNSTGSILAQDPNCDNVIYTMLLSGSNLYVGGQFSTINSVYKDNVACINTATGAPTSFYCGTNGAVKALALSGSNLVMGGYFTTVAGSTVNRKALAVVNATTGAVQAFNANISIGAIGAVAVAGNTIYAGSVSQVSDGITTTERNSLVAFNMVTSALRTYAPITNTNDSIFVLTVVNGTLYTSGAFILIGGEARSGLAAINMVANTITPFNPTITSFQSNGSVLGIYAFNDRLYLYGKFDLLNNSVLHENILAVDTANGGTINNAWNPPLQVFAHSLRGIAGDAGYMYYCEQYVPGSTGSYTKIGRIDIVSGAIDAWNTTFNNSVPLIYKLIITNNTLYMPAAYTGVAGANSWTLPGLVANGAPSVDYNSSFTYVSGIASIGDKIFVGGQFMHANNITNVRIGLLEYYATNAALSPWAPFTASGPSTGPRTVTSIATGGNRIFVGTIVPNTNPTGIASYYGINVMDTTTINPIFPSWKPTFADNTTAPTDLITMGQDTLFAFGGGETVSGHPFPYIVRFHLNGTYQTPAVSIVASTNTPCAGTTVTFTASTTATALSYQWKKGSTNVGTNSATFAYTPVNGDVITCTVTIAANGCITTTTPTSNALTMTVTPTVTGTASIVASSNPSCTGATVTYTATTNITGPTYQWQVNNVNVSGATNSTYAYVPVNGNSVKCIITPSAGNCFTVATSNAITMSVTGTSVTPTAAITTPNTTICSGTGVTFTATTNITGATYQWQVNNANVGTSTATYSYTPANNDQVKCIVTVPSAGCFTASQVTSNVITMTVNTTATPTLSIAASANPACAGTTVNFTATSNVTGVSYQWNVNNLNVGTNSNTYAYTPLNGDVVTCVTTTAAGACVTATTATSNSITMTTTANSVGTGSIVASANPVCSGTSVTFTATTNIPGANYQWQVNSTNVGTNSNTYAYVPTSGNAVSCIVTATTGTCFTGANTNTIFMTVNPTVTPTLAVAVSSNPACTGSSVNFTATSNVTGVTYQWQVNSTNAGTNASNYSYIPVNNDHVTCIATMPATGCYSANTITSNMVTMTVTAPATSTASIAASGNNVCAGVSVNYTATTNITNANYQWKVNNIAVGTNQNTYSNVPNNGDVVTCDVSLPATGGCFTPASLTSNALTMTVTPNVTLGISITAPNHVAVGATVNLTAVLTNAPASYNIDWKKNSVVFATTMVPNTSYTKAAGTDVIDATITATAGCYTPANASAVNVQDNVGVPGIGRNSTINIYPNPFSEKITIDGLAADDKIQLYDLAGRLLHQWQTDNATKEQSFQINDIADGSYFVKVLDANGAIKGVGTLKKL